MTNTFRFDRTAAALAIAFFEHALVHVKGEWAHSPFVLQPWQRRIVGDLFGWKRNDGTRRYRKAYIEALGKGGVDAGVRYAARLQEFERFFEALLRCKEAEGIVNSATAVLRMVEIVEAYLSAKEGEHIPDSFRTLARTASVPTGSE